MRRVYIKHIKQKATLNSWKSEPFGNLVEIPFERIFSDEEYQKLEYGLIPQVMEDKWFIYFEDGKLMFFRSWTGNGVFKVQLSKKEDSWSVESAFASSQTLDSWGTEYGVAILDFLVSNFLLDENKPFPRRNDIKEELPGVLQHSVAGSGYSEVEFTVKKPWWKFWDK